jgi:hypothetical protein
MSLPRNMATVLIGGALLLPHSGVEAQDRPVTRAVPLEIFTVSGARTPPPTLDLQSIRSTDEVAEPGVRPSRAVPAAEGARTEAMRVLSSRSAARPGRAGAIQAPAPAELQDVTLTSRRPWINNQAYVNYSMPVSVDNSTGVVRFSTNYLNFTTVYLNAAAGATYLVDFAVDAWGIGTYRVTSGDNAQTFPNANGQQHLMVGVQATTAGWVSVQLTRMDGSGYYVREVRVTRVN